MDKHLVFFTVLLPFFAPISMDAAPMCRVAIRQAQIELTKTSAQQERPLNSFSLKVDSKNDEAKRQIANIPDTKHLAINVIYNANRFGGQILPHDRNKIRDAIIQALDKKLNELRNLETVTIDLSCSAFDLQGITHPIDLKFAHPRLSRITLIGPKGLDLTATRSADVSYADWLIQLPSNFRVEPYSSAHQFAWVR